MRSTHPFLAVAALVVLLAGCGMPGLRRAQAEAEIRRHQADILQMYKECLQRKSIDAQVDCSEFRRAVDVNVRVRPE